MNNKILTNIADIIENVDIDKIDENLIDEEYKQFNEKNVEV